MYVLLCSKLPLLICASQFSFSLGFEVCPFAEYASFLIISSHYSLFCFLTRIIHLL